MSKITITELRKIISEEIKNLREGANEDQAAAMASSASKLLKAIESFKEVATAKAKADLGTHVDETEKLLKRIVASPMQYIDAPKPAVKKVTLKPGAEEKPAAPAEKVI